MKLTKLFFVVVSLRSAFLGFVLLLLILPSTLLAQAPCDTVAECDDGNACTVDACLFSPSFGYSRCVYQVNPCNDSDHCTDDSCDPATGCLYAPIACNDGNACTDDSCNSAIGCLYAPITCDDGVLCNGTETCDSIEGCQPGTPQCDPATETCNETEDICEPIGCTSDAECDDGVFCNGTETCDIDTGSCVAVSACPPYIDGCVIRNAICDEDNNVCIDEIDDSLCEEGETCLPTDGLCVACDSNPRTQGYWYRQCLGLASSEGGIEPGRNGRGPQEAAEPGFVDVLIPCTDLLLEDLGFFGTTTCEGMDANPPSDDCERALKQLTALMLNVCSDRLQSHCPVCIADTCTDILPEDSDVRSLIDGVAEYIFAGMCKEAAELAALANEGEAICVFDP